MPSKNNPFILHSYIRYGRRKSTLFYLFDENGELDLGVLGRSLLIGGGTGLYGDIINNLSSPRIGIIAGLRTF
jgi:hypothetical protein